MARAHDFLAELGCADSDAWDHEQAAELLEWAGSLSEGDAHAAVRDACLLRAAAQPVIMVIITIAVHATPGEDVAEDAELAAAVALNRRTVLTFQAAGLNGRLAKRNLGLLDRVDALLSSWPEPAWSDAVRRRVEQLLDARRAGCRRGEQLRAAGRMPDPPPEPSVPWLLCHPGDHWFRRARPAITDPILRAAIDDWIADFAPSYATLAAGDWSAEEERADLVVDLELPDKVLPGWEDPVPTVVVAKRHGRVEIGSQLPLRLVPDGDEPFNGVLIEVLPRERWRTCATLLSDGSILPSDGTRRLQAPTLSTASTA